MADRVRRLALSMSGLVLVILLGIASGAGTYTFYYGAGYSYASEARQVERMDVEGVTPKEEAPPTPAETGK